MGVFGWSYPAGAEHDPNAPWNQEEPPDTCPICGAANDGAEDDCFPYCSDECAAKEDDGIDEP